MDSTNRKRRLRIGFYFALYTFIFMTYFPLPSGAIDDYLNTCTNSTVCEKFPWIKPYPVCKLMRCRCLNNTCIHKTTSNGGSIYEYFCGDCDELGAECRPRYPSSCGYPGKCIDDFCMCTKGFLEEGICWYFYPRFDSTSSLVLFMILLLILLLLKLFAARAKVFKFIRGVFSGESCQRCRNEDSASEVAYGYNPDSSTKSAAFTISSREFLPTTGDPELEWALELSAQAANTFSIFESEINRSEPSNEPSPAYFRSLISIRSRGGMMNSESQSGSYVSCSSSAPSSDRGPSSHASGSFYSLSSSSSAASTLNRHRPLLYGSERRPKTNDRIVRDSRDEVVLNHVIRQLATPSVSSTEYLDSPFLSGDTLKRAGSLPLRLGRRADGVTREASLPFKEVSASPNSPASPNASSIADRSTRPKERRYAKREHVRHEVSPADCQYEKKVKRKTDFPIPDVSMEEPVTERDTSSNLTEGITLTID